MYKKIIAAVIAVLVFSACSENNTEEISVSITSEPQFTETVKAVTAYEDEIITDSEDGKQFGFGYTTAETEEKTETSADETAAETGETELIRSGFNVDSRFGTNIDFKFHPEITAEDIEQIRAVCEIEIAAICQISNTDMGSMAFLSECKEVKELILNDLPTDTSELAAALSQMDSLEVLYITTSDYSDKAINDIFKNSGECRIEYYWNDKRDVEDVNGYDKCFSIGTYTPCAYDKNEDDGIHGVWFCNYTSDEVTIESAEIFYYYNDEWIPVEFADGTFSKTVNFTAKPMYNIYEGGSYELYDMPYDFQLDSENFEFENARTGRYKLSFKTDKGTFDSDFYVKSSSEYSFLTEEQKQVFIDASDVIGKYFSSTKFHPDEFPKDRNGDELIREKFCHCLTYDFARKISLGVYIDENGNVIWDGGERGSNVIYDGNYIQPVYVGEDKIIIKRIVVYSHSDGCSDFSMKAHNIVMVLTEEGWRVSSMYEYH